MNGFDFCEIFTVLRMKELDNLSVREEQTLIWDYYKPRHIHAWNMLVLSFRKLDKLSDETDVGFETEYRWENFILRLWLYRTTVKTLAKLTAVQSEAKNILKTFDIVFDIDGSNALKALRDMIEHFDDYAPGMGRGPAKRENDLDPWREFDRNRYERGQFLLERKKSYDAAIMLRSDAKRVSDEFIQWYKSPG
jgi:hypothetical protein